LSGRKACNDFVKGRLPVISGQGSKSKLQPQVLDGEIFDLIVKDLSYKISILGITTYQSG
jgi:hypothetical protein